MSFRPLTAALLLPLALSAGAAEAPDLSGLWVSKTSTVGVLQTAIGLTYRYEVVPVEGAPACHCVGTMIPADSRRSVKPGEAIGWVDPLSGLRASVTGKDMTLSPDPESPPTCCPEGWTGEVVSRKKGVGECKVVPDKAMLREVDAARAVKTEVYATGGDRLDAVPGPTINAKVYWLVRLPEPMDGVSTGLLRDDEVVCK